LPPEAADDETPVRTDGLAMRGRRHARGWSLRDLVEAIGDASERETGLRETLTPNVLRSMEERNARVPFATLRLVAAGLDCNPVELVAGESEEEAG